MMPLDFLTPCLKALEELVRRYGVSAVLCSATQPELSQYLSMKPEEIMENIPDMYQFFNRVSYRFDGERTYEEIAGAMQKTPQALCIASTKKRLWKYTAAWKEMTVSTCPPICARCTGKG